MKKCLLIFAVIFSLACVPAASAQLQIDPIIDFPANPTIPIDVIQIPDLNLSPILTQTLTVHIEGSGEVVSSPEGLVCSSEGLSGDTTCTHDFPIGTVVALTATSIDGESFTSQFIEWEGDCSGSGACPLIMNNDREVTARFGALGIPVFALPAPDSQNTYFYHPTETPVKSPDPSLCQPVGIGASYYSEGINLNVGLPPFGEAVDVYLAIQPPDSEPLLLNADSTTLTPLSNGVVAWKTDSSYENIDELLFGNIPLTFLNSGTYQLYLMVTPTGSMSEYYLWRSYFVILE